MGTGSPAIASPSPGTWGYTLAAPWGMGLSAPRVSVLAESLGPPPRTRTELRRTNPVAHGGSRVLIHPPDPLPPELVNLPQHRPSIGEEFLPGLEGVRLQPVSAAT